MKVKDLIKLLKEYRPNQEVRFATSPFDEVFLLSDYEDNKKIVWIDLGGENVV